MIYMVTCKKIPGKFIWNSGEAFYFLHTKNDKMQYLFFVFKCGQKIL